MKTYVEPQQEVIAEHKLASNVIRMKERTLRFLYICLGVGVVILVFGLISLLME